MNTNLKGRFSPETATQPSPEARRHRLDHASQQIDRRADGFDESFEVTIELLEFDNGEE
jgi:hypothetical protein